MASGIRTLDRLGRIVIPAELRRQGGLGVGDLVDLRVENGALLISKVEPECALCGRRANLVEVRGKHVCGRCIATIGQLRAPSAVPHRRRTSEQR